MRLLFLADTHCQHYDVVIHNPVDYLIFAGDGEFRTTSDLTSFNNWIIKLKKKKLIKEALICAGNHDFLPQRDPKLAKILLRAGKYLQDESYTLSNGMKLYMSPMSVTFMDWAFMGSEEDLDKNYWSKIPTDTDILVTHTPPNGILDYDTRNGYLGSHTLTKRVEQLKPKYHAFGHIHRDEGQRRYLETEHTKFINCGVLDNHYEMIWGPIMIEV